MRNHERVNNVDMFVECEANDTSTYADEHVPVQVLCFTVLL